jgi:hypothetical protein
MMAEWFKQAPHLPENARKWIVENAWWITAIGVVVAALFVFSLIPILTGASMLLSTYGALYAPYVDTGRVVLNAWISLAFFAVVIYLEAMAIMPLKEKRRRGWDFLFLAMLVSVVSSIVAFVVTLDASHLVTAVLGAVIGGYFLFEVRGMFVESKKTNIAP